MSKKQKVLLQEILSREQRTYNFADAAPLANKSPEGILSQFSFEEFSRLLERIRRQTSAKSFSHR